MGVNFLNVGLPASIVAALGTAGEQRERADRLATAAEERRRWESEFGLRTADYQQRLQEYLDKKRALGEFATFLERPVPGIIEQAMKTPAAGPGTPDYSASEEAFAFPPERIPTLIPPSPQRRAVSSLARSGLLPPELILKAAGIREPRSPVSVAPGGVLVDPDTGRVIHQTPPRPERPLTLSPGGVAVDPITGRPIFTAPPTPKEPRAPKVGTFTDATGNVNVYGIDEAGNLLFKKPLGKARTNEPRFNLGQFRADLAQRSQGLQVQDPQVQRMSREQAKKVLEELGRSDILGQFFQTNPPGGGGPAAGAPGKTTDELAAEFLKDLE